jgi:hypothetical protein
MGKRSPRGKSPRDQDEESYYDDEVEEPTLGDESRIEEEYLDFLEQYGHVDFSTLEFLPNLRSVDELQEIKRKKVLTSTKMVRTQALLNSNIDLNTQTSELYIVKPPKRKT